MCESLSFRVLPGCCLLCGRRSRRATDICEQCESELPFHSPACMRCGLGVSTAQTICGRCLRHPPPNDVFLAPFRYTFPLDGLIQRFKFNRDHAAGRVLSELLVRYLAAESPQALVPVPLHAKRLQERGFNQAVALFSPLAQHLDLPVLEHLVRRSRHTDVQSGMNAAARRRNVKNAFAVTTSELPAHVAVVDDVVTTGSTCREIAAVLKRAGVSRVDVWSLARTVSD